MPTSSREDFVNELLRLTSSEWDEVGPLTAFRRGELCSNHGALSLMLDLSEQGVELVFEVVSERVS